MGSPGYPHHDTQGLLTLAGKARTELLGNILPFWLRYMDMEAGGFQGYVGNDGGVRLGAPKGLVAQARFLWTYSAAYRRLGAADYLRAARQAYSFLRGGLYDGEGGGFFWAVDADRRPGFTEKVIYGQAFAIYALAEFYLATGELEALDMAMACFRLLEASARDRRGGGYAEACDRSFSAPIDFKLSPVDIRCAKSMNTNLHVLEALSTLTVASGSPEAMEALEAQTLVYAERAFAGKDNLSLYFNANWQSLSDHVSYGHDIESCWLLSEACQIVYGAAWPEAIRRRILSASYASLGALNHYGGSLPNELHAGHLDSARIWWVQAEAAVGYVNAFKLSGDERFLEAAGRVWDWIERYQRDNGGGDWFWSVDASGRPDLSREKGGMWKTCYHNGRACMEIMERSGLEGDGHGQEPV